MADLVINLLGVDGLSGVLERAARSFNSFADRVRQSSKRTEDSLFKLSGRLRGLQILLATFAFQPIITGITALGSAVLSLASSLAQAAAVLGGAFAAGLAQTLPVVGLLAASMSRLTKVFAAVKESQQLATRSGQELRTEQLQQRLAAEGLRTAQIALVNSYKQLALARREAKRDLEDMDLAQRRANLSSQEAAFGVLEADQARRSAVRGGTAFQLARAQTGAAGARLDRVGQERDYQRAVKDTQEALRKGIEQSDKVTQARENIRQATLGLAQAENALAVASAGAGSALQKALAELSPAERRLYTDVKRLRETFEKEFRPITDIVVDSLGGVTRSFNTILKDPGLLAAAKTLAGSLGDSFKSLGDFVARPSFIAQWTAIWKDAAKNTPLITEALQNMLQAFTNIAQGGGRTFTIVLQKIVDLTERWANISPERAGAFFERNLKHLDSWLSLLGSIKDLLGAIIGTFADSGTNLVDAFAGQLDRLTDYINNNQQAVRDFAQQAADVTKNIGSAIIDIGRALGEAFDPASAKAFLDFLTQVLIPVLGNLITALGGITRLITELLAAPVVSQFVVWAASFLGIVAALSKIRKGIESVGTAIGLLTKMNPWILAISALILVLIELEKRFQIVSRAIEGWQRLGTAVANYFKTGFVNDLSSIGSALRTFFVDLGGNIADWIVEGIQNAPGAIGNAIIDSIPGARGALNLAGSAGSAIGLATGGVVPGRPGDGDTIPARLTPGEVVLNQRQQQMVGADMIDAVLRSTGAPMGGRYFDGGRRSPLTSILGRYAPRGNSGNPTLTGPYGGRSARSRYVSRTGNIYGLEYWEQNEYTSPEYTKDVRWLNKLLSTKVISQGEYTDYIKRMNRKRNSGVYGGGGGGDLGRPPGSGFEPLTDSVSGVGNSMGGGSGAGSGLSGTSSAPETRDVAETFGQYFKRTLTSKTPRDAGKKDARKTNNLLALGLQGKGPLAWYANYVKQTLYPAFRKTRSITVSGAGSAGSANLSAAQAFAEAQLGEPYVWGAGHSFGDFNSWDCSGFATNVASRVPGYTGGIGTTYTTYASSTEPKGGEPVLFGYSSFGARGNEGPGHMGIVLGDTVYHAGNPVQKTNKGRFSVYRVPAGLAGLGQPAATGEVGGASGTNQQIGRQMAAQRGWSGQQWAALRELWQRESGWRHLAANPSGAYGIPQALPGSKMASAGEDWKTNPRTQIAWGLGYISGRYNDPVGALAHKNNTKGQYGNADGWYATGGEIPGEGQPVPIVAHGGEMVLNRGQQAKLGGPSRLRSLFGFRPRGGSFAAGGEIGNGSREDRNAFKSALDQVRAAVDPMFFIRQTRRALNVVLRFRVGIEGFYNQLVDGFAKLSEGYQAIADRQATALTNFRVRALKGIVGFVRGVPTALTGTGFGDAVNQTDRDIAENDFTLGQGQANRTLAAQNLAQARRAVTAAQARLRRSPRNKQALNSLEQAQRAVEEWQKALSDANLTIYEAAARAIELQRARARAVVEEINARSQDRTGGISFAQRIEELFGGRGGVISDLMAQQQSALYEQRVELGHALNRANASGDSNLARDITAQIRDIDLQISELGVSRLQTLADEINANATRAQSQSSNRVSRANASLIRGSAFGTIANELMSNGASLGAQRGALAGLQAQAAAQGNMDLFRELGDQIDDLDTAMVENTKAIRDNTVASFEFRSNERKGANDFAGSVLDVRGRIAQIGTAAGFFMPDQSALIGLGQQRGALLQKDAAQISAELAEAMKTPDLLRDQIRDLELQLLNNQLAQLENTKELAELNGEMGRPQATSLSWKWFREAIFNEGGLLPKYQVPQLQTGGMITKTGLFKLEAGEAVLRPDEVRSGMGQSIHVNLTNPTEVADPNWLAKRVAFEMKSRGG